MLENRDRREGVTEGRWKEGKKEERENTNCIPKKEPEIYTGLFKFKFKVRVYLRSVLL